LKQGEVALTQSGGLDISLLAPEYGALSTPYVFPTIESVFKAWEGPIGKGIKDAFLTKGKVHVLGYQRRGARMLTAKKEIKTPDALKGVKLRLPEIPDWVAVWKELGALPTVVAWPEVFRLFRPASWMPRKTPCTSSTPQNCMRVQSHHAHLPRPQLFRLAHERQGPSPPFPKT
jgi:TRAP-type C4-dicarboxylate transport system substrate-binding protein